ncbi:hypothetical protein [Marinicella meishanensis]|uniref:hypothetical protein n=1 Tax=Marinicella meishanensis TaxID=2873263 RepID=UPI001CBAB440|nr:hypothetical protein [Marinicella sp. NBU2979]
MKINSAQRLGLVALLVLILLAGCQPAVTADGERNFYPLVDNEAKFIGQGLQVPNADPRWDWLLPDLHSTALASATHHAQPPDADAVRYLRSFTIHGDLGFVWGWQHQGVEIYLLYIFLGDNGYIKRVLHNTSGMTLDEVILITYFDHDFFAVNWQENWVLTGLDDAHDIEALGFLGQSVFGDGAHGFLFDGRIVTLNWVGVHPHGDAYQVCDSTHSQDECLPLPPSFRDMVEAAGLTEDDLQHPGNVFDLKIQFGADGRITQILGGRWRQHQADDSLRQLAVWPVSAEFLGAGSVPVDVDNDCAAGADRNI